MEAATKDMIIKLGLEDETLQKLIQTAQNADMSLSHLFACFIDDLTSETSPGSTLLEDWLALHLNLDAIQQADSEDDLEENVILSSRQMDIMNLMDAILDNRI